MKGRPGSRLLIARLQPYYKIRFFIVFMDISQGNYPLIIAFRGSALPRYFRRQLLVLFDIK